MSPLSKIIMSPPDFRPRTTISTMGRVSRLLEATLRKARSSRSPADSSPKPSTRLLLPSSLPPRRRNQSGLRSHSPRSARAFVSAHRPSTSGRRMVSRVSFMHATLSHIIYHRYTCGLSDMHQLSRTLHALEARKQHTRGCGPPFGAARGS